jgi:hypothetical protein
MERMFRLTGERVDLEALTHLFRKGPALVKKIGENYCMELAEWKEAGDDQDALAAADTALARMHAVALMTDARFRPSKIFGIVTKDPTTGELRTGVPLKGHSEARVIAHSELRLTPPDVSAKSSETPTMGESLLLKAESNDALERALHLYGSLKHAWRELYMVLEAIEDGNGGERRLVSSGLSTEPQIKNFKATANSYRALGLEARHGSTTSGVDQVRMTLKEAQAFIRELLNAWARKLGS